MGKENLKHGRTCVYNVNYHIVWSVKYRRKVLNESVALRLKSILAELATANGFDLAMAAVGNADHIHVFVSAHPKIAPCSIVKILKGGSAYSLFKHFPHLRTTLRKGRLWNPSYDIETVGSISEEAIVQYIAQQ